MYTPSKTQKKGGFKPAIFLGMWYFGFDLLLNMYRYGRGGGEGISVRKSVLIHVLISVY